MMSVKPARDSYIADGLKIGGMRIMDERACETCRHEEKSLDQSPCSNCDVVTGSGWEQKDPDEYVKEVFRRRYDKKDRQ